MGPARGSERTGEAADDVEEGGSSRFAHRGLTIRIILVQIGALVSLGLILGWVNYTRTRKDLESAVTQRALSLSRSLAHGGKLGVLTGDTEILEELLNGLAGEDLFAFALFSNSEGALAAWGETPDLSFLIKDLAESDEETILAAGENPTGLVLFTVPVFATIASGDAFEEEFLAFGDDEEETSSGQGLDEGRTRVGSVVTGISRVQIEKPVQSALRVNILVLLVLIVLLSALLSLILIASFRPLNNIVEAFRDIAMGGGDLTHRIDVSSKDEIGTAGKWFNTFVEYLHKVILKVRATTQAIDGSSANLAARSKELLEGANAQINEVSLAVKSVESLNHSISAIGGSVGMVQESMEGSSASAGELAANIKEIDRGTNDLFERVKEVNGSLSVMNQNLSDIADSVKNVHTSSESTASALTQFDSAVKSIEQHTKSTAETTRQTDQLAVEGMQRMDETMGGMEAINEAFEEIRQHMDVLGEHLHSVGDMLATIREVADQTNLLSLNASILAAQAGEHGRGFNVLAEEIGSLADTSASSVKKIATVLVLVKEQSEKVAAAMEVGLNKVTAGRELTDHTRVSLEKITSGIKDTFEHVQEIVKSGEEQARNSSLINMEVQNLVKTIEVIEQSSRRQMEESSRISEASNEIREGTRRVQVAISEQMQNSAYIKEAMGSINAEQAKLRSNIQSQETGSEEIFRSMTSIKKISEENLRAIKDMEGLIESTKRQSEHLHVEVERLKV